MGVRAQSWGSCRDRLQGEGEEAFTNTLPGELCPKGSRKEMGMTPSQEGAPGLPCKVQPLEFLGSKGHLVEIPHRDGSQRKWAEGNPEALE